jgi:cytochrome P450
MSTTAASTPPGAQTSGVPEPRAPDDPHTTAPRTTTPDGTTDPDHPRTTAAPDDPTTTTSCARASEAAPPTRLPPGPRWPLALQSILTWNRTIPWLEANRRKYGPVFTIRSLPWGRAVVIADSDLVKQVFTGDPAVYHAGDGNSMLAPVLGERSVLVLDEDVHLQARKRLLPPFHGESVRRYGEVVQRIVAEEAASWPLGKPFPLHPRMRAITLEVILQAVIGVTDPVRLRALREVLQRTTLRADRARDERARNHHITLVPARGARVVREA